MRSIIAIGHIARKNYSLKWEKAGGSWSCEDMTIVLLHAKVFRFLGTIL
jgi:hypothetical protein